MLLRLALAVTLLLNAIFGYVCMMPTAMAVMPDEIQHLAQMNMMPIEMMSHVHVTYLTQMEQACTSTPSTSCTGHCLTQESNSSPASIFGHDSSITIPPDRPSMLMANHAQRIAPISTSPPILESFHTVVLRL